MRASIILMLLVLPWGSIWAAPVTWTLSDVLLDGSTFTGSFDYDADTDRYSNVSIISTFYTEDPVYLDYGESGGYVYLDFYELGYIGPYGVGPTSRRAQFEDSHSFGDISYFLTLNFASSLTNSGGEIAIQNGEILLQDVWEESVTPISSGVSGSVMASVVPIPAAAWLFASALIGMGWMRRKQTA
jgi:hypothetical protein